MNADRRLGMLLLVPVALASLFATVRLGLEGGDVPADAEYPEIYQALAADGFDAQQDALAVLPPWSLRAWVDAPARPISSDQLSEDGLERYRRVYVLVEPDPSDEWTKFVARHGEGWTVAHTERLALHKVEPQDAPLAYDFRERLAEARIELRDQKGQTTLVCTEAVRLGVHCDGRKEWQRVTREHRLVTENGRDVLWIHPPKKNERIAVVYPEVSVDQLVLGYGFTRTGANGKDWPVRFKVTVGEEVVLDETVPRVFRFQQARVRAKKPGPVTFEVWAQGSNSGAHFTFDAYALGPAEGQE